MDVIGSSRTGSQKMKICVHPKQNNYMVLSHQFVEIRTRDIKLTKENLQRYETHCIRRMLHEFVNEEEVNQCYTSLLSQLHIVNVNAT